MKLDVCNLVSCLLSLFPQAIVLEGSYWKQRIEVVIKEYHKWRIYYKKRVKNLFLQNRFLSLVLHIFTPARDTAVLDKWLVHTFK